MVTNTGIQTTSPQYPSLTFIFWLFFCLSLRFRNGFTSWGFQKQVFIRSVLSVCIQFSPHLALLDLITITLIIFTFGMQMTTLSTLYEVLNHKFLRVRFPNVRSKAVPLSKITGQQSTSNEDSIREIYTAAKKGTHKRRRTSFQIALIF
jgi:hypothetical protein